LRCNGERVNKIFRQKFPLGQARGGQRRSSPVGLLAGKRTADQGRPQVGHGRPQVGHGGTRAASLQVYGVPSGKWLSPLHLHGRWIIACGRLDGPRRVLDGRRLVGFSLPGWISRTWLTRTLQAQFAWIEFQGNLRSRLAILVLNPTLGTVLEIWKGHSQPTQ
jgi:hypothetical protein